MYILQKLKEKKTYKKQKKSALPLQIISLLASKEQRAFIHFPFSAPQPLHLPGFCVLSFYRPPAVVFFLTSVLKYVCSKEGEKKEKIRSSCSGVVEKARNLVWDTMKNESKLR